MPVPFLPNELITLIFEHLFRLLCVHPGEDFPDVPTNSPNIFAPFCRVSKTWRNLALPFLYRHLSEDHLDQLYHHSPSQVETATALVRSLSDGRQALGKDKVKKLFQATAARLQRISYSKRHDKSLHKVLWSSKLPAMGALRRLEVDFRQHSTVDPLTILCRLASKAPALEHLTLTSNELFLRTRPAESSGAWQQGLSQLRVLDLRRFNVTVEFFSSVIINRLVRPSSVTLTDLSLQIAFKYRAVHSFTSLIPFPLPNLRSLHCHSSEIDCQELDLATIAPNITRATISLPGSTPVLPPLPPSLTYLAISSLRKDTFTSISNQLQDLLLLDVNRNETSRALPALRTLGLNVHNSKPPDPLSEAEESLSILAEVASARSITLHSDALAYCCLSLDEEEEAARHVVVPVRSEAQRSVGRVYRARVGGGAEEDEEEEEEEEGAAKGDENEDENASEMSTEEGKEYDVELDEEEDWDAEEWFVFRRLWSEEKRLEYDAANPYTTVTLRLA